MVERGVGVQPRGGQARHSWQKVCPAYLMCGVA